MGGASPSRLASNLGLDASPAPGLYLADADVLVVLGCRQGVPVVIHVAQDAQRVNRYRQSADQARQQLASAALSHLVPAVIEQRTVLDLTMLVQQRLVGQTLRPSDLSADELERYVKAALQPLRALALGSSVAAEGADHGLVSQELNWLESHPQLGAAVRRPLAALRDWPGRRQHPAVLAHGDYCFPNLLFEPGSPRLAGLIDWERSRPRACAGFDALYLVLFCFSAWRGGSPMRVLCMLWDNLCEPVLERLLAEAGQATGLDIEDLRHVASADLAAAPVPARPADMQDWSDAHRRDWLDRAGRQRAALVGAQRVGPMPCPLRRAVGRARVRRSRVCHQGITSCRGCSSTSRTRGRRTMQLYYFKDRRGNFGDDLNPWLWRQLLPEVMQGSPDELFVGIGTLLNHRLPAAPLKHVFGSGHGYGTKAGHRRPVALSCGSRFRDRAGARVCRGKR